MPLPELLKLVVQPVSADDGYDLLQKEGDSLSEDLEGIVRALIFLTGQAQSSAFDNKVWSSTFEVFLQRSLYRLFAEFFYYHITNQIVPRGDKLSEIL